MYFTLTSLNNLHFWARLFTMFCMSEIREDQKAKLSFKMADNSEKELECVVKDIQKDRLSLAFPRETLSYVEYLQEGSEVPVKIFTPSGVRMFNAMVLNSPLEPDFVIEYVEDSIQIQRREYPRVKFDTKVIIERATGENIVTQTFDIGGGGLRFRSDADFAQNEPVSCRLYFKEQVSSLKIEGIILKKPHLQPYERVLFFTKILESDRDKIVKKCFEIESSYYMDA